MSDLSVFHRIDDWETMSAYKFVTYVERLPFYRGAMRDIAIYEKTKSGEISTAPPPHDENSGLPPAIEVLKAS